MSTRDDTTKIRGTFLEATVQPSREQGFARLSLDLIYTDHSFYGVASIQLLFSMPRVVVVHKSLEKLYL